MFQKLSIQSKLTLILLAVSVSSILVIAVIGYRSGKEALTNSIYNQLTSLRYTTSSEIEEYFLNVNREVLTMAQNPAIVTATSNFQAAYQKLETSPAQNFGPAIDTYYRDTFIPQLKPSVDGDPLARTFQPVTPVQRYLQFHYTIKSKDFDALAAIDDPGDGSDYSKIHRNIHPYLRKFVKEFQHEDLFLIDAKTGHVIYSVFKGIDFTASVKSGYLEQSVLADAFRKVIRERTPGYSVLEDYQPYAPSFNAPAAIIASPIFNNGDLIAVLAVQVSADPINARMTHNQEWEKAGLGKSGETYLVGPDTLMRSNSRYFLENSENYYQALSDNGTDDQTLEKIKRLGTSILTQEIDTESTLLANKGKEGTHITEDYRGVSVLSSYAPLNALGLKWSVIAEIDEAEAFAPIVQFQKRVFISTAGIVLLITLISLALAHYLVRPIRTLQAGFAKVGEGKMDTEIHLNSRDEFHDLAVSFNTMVNNLRSKTVLLKQKSQENEALLLSILPSPVAKRLKTGEDTIADSHASVTVLFADLVGFASLCETMPAEESVALLNKLVTAFDDSIERYGVEKIKTIGSGYMAVGGLSIARIDHLKRTIDFGLDMIRVVQMFNATNNTELKIQIGVHTGSVVAGIVGKSKFIYDLWGESVSIAHDMKITGIPDGIHVNDSIYRQLKEFYSFREHHYKEGEEAIPQTWILRE